MSQKSFYVSQGTNFCGTAENRPRPVSEFLYNIVMGFVGIFEYLHLKDGPTRFKLIFFYLLTFGEGVALMTMWYQQTTADVKSLICFPNLKKIFSYKAE